MKLSTQLTAAATAMTIAFAWSTIGFGFAEDDVSVSHTFHAGEKAVAEQVNRNFSDLVAAIRSNGVSIQALQADANRSNPQNVVTVAKSGGDFDSVVDAMNSFQDESEENPYLVLVFPGVYVETEAITVRAFIELQGAGANVTTIRREGVVGSEFASNSVVILEDLAALSNISLVNSQKENVAGIFGDKLSRQTQIRDVSVRVDGGGGAIHYGILIENSDVTIDRCSFRASGATGTNVAMRSSDTQGNGYATPLMMNSSFDAEGLSVFGAGYGLELSFTSADIRNCQVRGTHVAIRALQEGTSRIRNSQVQTSSASPVYEQTGIATILSGSVTFVGGDPVGLATGFKYVHCMKSDFDRW